MEKSRRGRQPWLLHCNIEKKMGFNYEVFRFRHARVQFGGDVDPAGTSIVRYTTREKIAICGAQRLWKRHPC